MDALFVVVSGPLKNRNAVYAWVRETRSEWVPLRVELVSEKRLEDGYYLSYGDVQLMQSFASVLINVAAECGCTARVLKRE